MCSSYRTRTHCRICHAKYTNDLLCHNCGYAEKKPDEWFCVQYYIGTKGGICVMPRGCQWRQTSLRNHGIGQHIFTRTAVPEETIIIKSYYRLKYFWYNIDDLLLDSEELLPPKLFQELKEKLDSIRPLIKQRKEKKQRRLPILGQAEMEDGL